MSVFRRKYPGGKHGQVYWYKFTFNGQIIFESAKTNSKSLAQKAELARRRELEYGYNRIARRAPMPLFRVAAEQWQAGKAGLADKTIRGYKQRTSPLLDAFGSRLVCDIARDDILEYRSRRLEEGASTRTVNYEVGCLRGVLSEYGIWPNVAAKGTSRELKPLKENHDVGRQVPYEHEDQLLRAAAKSTSPSLLPLFIMGIDTGLREAELKSLRRRDLTLERSNDVIRSGHLTVPKSKTEAGKGRLVPLTPRVCAALTTWLDRFPNATEDNYVFPRHSVIMLREGKGVLLTRIRLDHPVQSWMHAWRTALKEAGLRYRWHDLRHTFVTRLLENPNISEETIRSLAGHVSRQMLERYSHIRVQRKQDAIAAIAQGRQEYEAGIAAERIAAERNSKQTGDNFGSNFEGEQAVKLVTN